jgi:protein SCO1
VERFGTRRAGCRLAAVLAAIAVAAGAGCTDHSPGDGTPSGRASAVSVAADGRPPAADFELTDQNGEPFRLAAQRGRPVVLFFGYTHCPDICPTTLSAWSQVERQLGDAAGDVTFAFVTVDPERDTPARLAKHLAVFSPRFVGLSGKRTELRAVYDAYGVEPQKVVVAEGASGYLVDHPTAMVLLDRSGRIARRMNYASYPAEIADALRRLLGEPSPSLVVADVWSWPTAPEDHAAGGHGAAHGSGPDAELGPGVVYATIRNVGTAPDRLLSVDTGVCETVELHETVEVDGRMRMRPLPGGLEIPAGGTVQLRPGAHHVMLLRLKHDLVAGERFDVTFTFRDAGEVMAASRVRGI